MPIKRYILNILILVLYIAIGIPLVSQFLLPMVIDFLNASPMFLSPSWCSTIYRYENNTLVNYQECTTLDMKPLILFLVQVGVYVLIPIMLVFGLVRRR